MKHFNRLENPHRISELPASIRGNVLKAMANLSKFLEVYSDYQKRLKNSGIKWLFSARALLLTCVKMESY